MVLLPNDEEVANFSKKHTCHTLFQTTMVETDTLFQTKTAKKNHTLWRGTYLYSRYKGLPPPPTGGGEKRFADHESRCLRKRD